MWGPKWWPRMSVNSLQLFAGCKLFMQNLVIRIYPKDLGLEIKALRSGEDEMV